MRFVQSKLPDAWLIEPEPIGDERGYFMRSFCARAFAERGLETRFVQHSQSYSARKGTLRGMHFQTAPHAEVKVVSCFAGAIYDVIVDLRPGSPTYRKWQAFELTAENQRQLYIPAGFAHGFQTLTEGAGVSYLISNFYEPSASTGVSYDDPVLGIRWPLPVAAISDRDKAWALLAA
jgi:dTDP-4-dehydrorhamnose 3,5-epimerase